MGAATTMREEPAQIPLGPAAIQGDLGVPAGAACVVLFAHGKASSRQSPRNRYVARALQGDWHATLLIDLRTLEEEAVDLQEVAEWLPIAPGTTHLIEASDTLEQVASFASEWFVGYLTPVSRSGS